MLAYFVVRALTSKNIYFFPSDDLRNLLAVFIVYISIVVLVLDYFSVNKKVLTSWAKMLKFDISKWNKLYR